MVRLKARSRPGRSSQRRTCVPPHAQTETDGKLTRQKRPATAAAPAAAPIFAQSPRSTRDTVVKGSLLEHFASLAPVEFFVGLVAQALDLAVERHLDGVQGRSGRVEPGKQHEVGAGGVDAPHLGERRRRRDDDRLRRDLPSHVDDVRRVTPVYETLPGWSEDVTGVRALADLFKPRFIDI